MELDCPRIGPIRTNCDRPAGDQFPDDLVVTTDPSSRRWRRSTAGLTDPGSPPLGDLNLGVGDRIEFAPRLRAACNVQFTT